MTLNEKDPRSRSHWPPLGWEAGSPQAHGMKDELLWSADETIRRGLPNVYSRLVVRNSTIVFEQYYQGHAATSLFDIRSATKSFISALISRYSPIFRSTKLQTWSLERPRLRSVICL